MGTDEEIGRHAKEFCQKGEGVFRFARFLFVPPEEADPEILSKLSELDKDTLNLPYMQNKTRVFEVVCQEVEERIGTPVRVKEKDRYLVFYTESDSD